MVVVQPQDFAVAEVDAAGVCGGLLNGRQVVAADVGFEVEMVPVGKRMQDVLCVGFEPPATPDVVAFFHAGDDMVDAGFGAGDVGDVGKGEFFALLKLGAGVAVDAAFEKAADKPVGIL